MKPFSRVQSLNFKFLLFVARVMAFLAFLLLIGAIGSAVWFTFTESPLGALTSLPIAIWSVSMFVFAGIIALLVSIEEHLRMQEVRDVRNGKI